MKRILLILSLLIALPAFSMQAAETSWSWKGLASSFTNTVCQKPALLGLGAAALAATAYGVYNFYSTKKPEPQNVQPIVAPLVYDPLLASLSHVQQLNKKNLKNFLTMLKKSTERDLVRLEGMLKENTTGDTAFDCIFVWNTRKDLSEQLSPNIIRAYNKLANRFSKIAFMYAGAYTLAAVESVKYFPLTTRRQVRQAYADVQSLQEAVEAAIT